MFKPTCEQRDNEQRDCEEWESIINVDKRVRAVTSWQKNCHIAAGYGSNTEINMYDIGFETCQPIWEIPDVFRKRGHFSMCTSENTEEELIFLIGQPFDNQSGQQSAFLLDTRQGKWGIKPSLQVGFQWPWLSSAFGINTVYVAASHVEDRQFDAHVYSLDLAFPTEWKVVSAMETLYSTLARVETYMTSTGGRSKANYQPVSNICCFDNLAMNWCSLPSMTTARVAPGVCVLGNRSITVMGQEMDIMSGEILKTYP